MPLPQGKSAVEHETERKRLGLSMRSYALKIGMRQATYIQKVQKNEPASPTVPHMPRVALGHALRPDSPNVITAYETGCETLYSGIMALPKEYRKKLITKINESERRIEEALKLVMALDPKDRYALMTEYSMMRFRVKQ